MAPADDIEFLREFRSKVQRYLYLGAAPAEEDFMPVPALGKMHLKLDQDPDYRELRREINEDKGRAHQILSSLGVPTVYVQYPAPAIGGPVLRFYLLDLITENRSAEIISLDTFLDKIDEAIGKLKHPQRSPQSPKVSATMEVDAGFVFIAMPMDPAEPALEDVHDAIKGVALELELTAERVDDPESNQRITDRILASLERAQFVVADLTLGRPNVYYEAGYAHAMGKIPIYIARAGTKIEFDLKDYPVIFFGNMRELRHGLRRRLGALTER
jgi:hypothetical protein